VNDLHRFDMRRYRTSALPLAFLLIVTSTAKAQPARTPDLDVIERIRKEGLKRSRIDHLAHELNDAIGPRLTASPGMRRAQRWAVEKLAGWGLNQVVTEPWGEFGRGWEMISYSGRVLTPYVQPLLGLPLAWTGSTNGRIGGPVVIVSAARIDIAGMAIPTADELNAAGDLQGAIVLMNPRPQISPDSGKRVLRWDADDLLRPASGSGGGMSLAVLDSVITDIRRTHAQRDRRLRAAGVAAVLTPSAKDDGIISGLASWGGIAAGAVEPTPEIVISQEQYNQLHRLVSAGVPVRVELQVENRFHEDDRSGYNVLADLPGTERPGEYVMVGAHFDSWHLAPGATDNAAGSIIMMEAMRILRALDLQPRRTIRLALWSGEEQGLLGSKAWVAAHPELHDAISIYLNLDNGAGRIRGIRNQLRASLTPVFEEIFWPLKDLGVIAVRNSSSGSTDHLVFEEAGIPGLTFIQDPLEYDEETGHSNLDTYDHLILDDLRQAAAVVAVIAYHLAMRDELLAR